MATFLLFLTIIFGVGTITTFIISLWAKDSDVRDSCSTICFILLIVTTLSGVGSSGYRRELNKKKLHEFPATKYELKYKVTEFDGVSDTTYVLVPKNNE